MKQDTKEVLNTIIDSLSLQIQAMKIMADSIRSLELRIAELTEALDENSDEIAKLGAEVAKLPKAPLVTYPNYPPVPNTPWYPEVVPRWTVNYDPISANNS